MSDRERKRVPDQRSDILNTHCDIVIKNKAILKCDIFIKIKTTLTVTYSLRPRQHSLLYIH